MHRTTSSRGTEVDCDVRTLLIVCSPPEPATPECEKLSLLEIRQQGPDGVPKDSLERAVGCLRCFLEMEPLLPSDEIMQV